MAGPHGPESSTSSYDTFINDVKYECELLWGVTERKIKEEKSTLENCYEITFGGASIYEFFNSETVGNVESVKSLYEFIRDTQIYEFARQYCFDIQPIYDAQASLVSAYSKFEIGTPLRVVTEKLADAWPEDGNDDNDTAKIFRENYIDPVADVFAEQKTILKMANEDLDAVTQMVNMNRESLLTALRDARDEMEKYDPKSHMVLGSLHVTFFVWGLVAPDAVSGPAASLADAILSETQSNLVDTNISCAYELVQELNFAMSDALDNAEEVVGGVRGEIDSRNSQLASNDVDYTLKAPSA